MTDWPRMDLGEVLSLEYGRALPGRMRDGGGFPVFGSNGVVGYHSTPLVTGPGIVVGRKGTAGSVTWVESDFTPIDTTYWVRPLRPAYWDMKFLLLILESADLPGICAQTGVPGLNRDRAYELQVPLPDLGEQRRIVDLIGVLDAQVATLRAEAEAAGRLWWRLASELESEVEVAPWVAMGEICAIAGGLTKNKKDQGKPDLVEVPYLRVANVHRRYLDLGNVVTIMATRSQLDALRLQPGDILLNEGGDKDKLGRGAVWRGEIDDCIHQNHVFRARVTDPAFTPEFISAWANSFGQRWFESFGTQTTGIASISKSTLSRFPIPRVPMTRQREWGELFVAVDAAQQDVEAEAERLAVVRGVTLESLLRRETTLPDSYDSFLESA